VKEITEAVRNQIEFLAEFLGFKKVLEARDVSFVKSELLRLSAKPLTNPLTKEEAWRLRELIEKEKLTLEEADELREIARKTGQGARRCRARGVEAADIRFNNEGLSPQRTGRGKKVDSAPTKER
jgi:hypothetical protein